MATTPVMLSIEEYLQTTYKPDVDFLNGELEERFMGEHSHNFIQNFICFLFTANSDAWGVEAVPEQRVKFGSSGVRVCDVAILDANAPFEEVVSTPPLLCIEIMSAQDRLSRAASVLADYFSMGVANIWLIDPVRRCAYTYGAHGLRLVESSMLMVPASPIQLDLADMFLRLDRKVAGQQNPDAQNTQ